MVVTYIILALRKHGGASIRHRHESSSNGVSNGTRHSAVAVGTAELSILICRMTSGVAVM